MAFQSKLPIKAPNQDHPIKIIQITAYRLPWLLRRQLLLPAFN
jgi:hypothetical protein